jgi:hypothetical protein
MHFIRQMFSAEPGDDRHAERRTPVQCVSERRAHRALARTLLTASNTLHSSHQTLMVVARAVGRAGWFTSGAVLNEAYLTRACSCAQQQCSQLSYSLQTPLYGAFAVAAECVSASRSASRAAQLLSNGAHADGVLNATAPDATTNSSCFHRLDTLKVLFGGVMPCTRA